MLRLAGSYACFIILYSAVNKCHASTEPIRYPNDNDMPSLDNRFYTEGVVNKYDSYINNLISVGISNLTLTTNKFLFSTSGNSNNIVFSPISITAALALVLLGANGKTFQEVSTALGLQVGINDIADRSQRAHEIMSSLLKALEVKSGFKLESDINVGTAVFVQTGYPIRPLYKSVAEDFYNSTVINIDFHSNARSGNNWEIINDWVVNKTHGKIKNVLSEQPPDDTKVILASVLYFNAEWENPFFDHATNKRPFFINGRKSPSTFSVDMMANGGDFPYYKDKELGCEIVGFPYKGRQSTMYVIMPFNSSITNLENFLSKLTVHDLHNLIERTVPTGIVTIFPKMIIESTIDLEQPLQFMGIKSLFDPRNANLALLADVTRTTYNETITQSSINYLSRQVTGQVAPTLDNIRQSINQQSRDNNYLNPGLYADKVIHKVYMDINEKGTEAAAATSVLLGKDGRKIAFRVDVPFCFFIRHEETKTILFWGSVTKPTPSYR